MAENKEVVSRFLDAIGGGDAETVQSLLAADMTWWVPRPFGEEIGKETGKPFPESGIFSGRDTILGDLLVPVVSLFVPGTLKMTAEDMISDGDKVAVTIHLDADVVKGGTYSNDYAMIMTIREGTIVDVREYPDTLYAVRTLCR